MSNILDLLHRMGEEEASDLFLIPGKIPRLRVYGNIRELADCAPLQPDVLSAFFAEHLSAELVERLARERDLDVGISLNENERFRLNLFYQKGRPACVARRVPSGALDFASLNLPSVIKDLAELSRGLVLVTGSTGAGKSSTMAAMLHHINSHFSKHIVTIEDPIEFVHRDDKSIVTQREVGNDTSSYAASLRYVVRQSPDVIFLGELRDLETIKTALSAAMTGHLVIATVHTMDVNQTLERVINYFQENFRDQVAEDLSLALAGIIAQRLLPRRDQPGLIPVFEILRCTPLVRRRIARRELDDLQEILKAGAGDGMTTFTHSLLERYRQGTIELDTALSAASNREEFLLVTQGMETGVDTIRHAAGAEDGGELTMRSLLKAAIRHQASDLLITADSPPMLRINGDLIALKSGPLSPRQTRSLLFSILAPAQRARFESSKEIDTALSVTGLDDNSKDLHGHRFRVNGFYQRGTVASAIRVVPRVIPTPEDLGLPPILLELVKRQHGLFLVTGPTGHGKSTTLACLINEINRTRPCHIITIEDPIEYVHENQKAVIDQREIYADTDSFGTALKYVLRQDPDVILVGEMRDQETIAAALTAAETGHLVLGTLHTNDAVQTINRVIDSFPAYQQEQIRVQFSASLLAVVSQRLLPTLKRRGRIACYEVLVGTLPVRSLIRDNRTHQILATMETAGKDGMITLDRALQELYSKNKISRETASLLMRHDRS